MLELFLSYLCNISDHLTTSQIELFHLVLYDLIRSTMMTYSLMMCRRGWEVGHTNRSTRQHLEYEEDIMKEWTDNKMKYLKSNLFIDESMWVLVLI